MIKMVACPNPNLDAFCFQDKRYDQFELSKEYLGVVEVLYIGSVKGSSRKIA